MITLKRQKTNSFQIHYRPVDTPWIDLGLVVEHGRGLVVGLIWALLVLVWGLTED